MELDRILIIAAVVCFVIAFICSTGSNLILGLGSIGWIAAGLAVVTLARLFGGVSRR
ncbi:MAG TPA: hypothetical protein VIJ33_02695 [Solirubrobacteraceae bacterium]